MKKFFCTLMILSAVFSLCFAKGKKSDIKIKVTEERETLQESENPFPSAPSENSNAQVQFDFPTEKKEHHNVIKADLGIPATNIALAIYQLLPNQMIRVPLTYELAFSKHVAFQLELEALSYFIMPNALGVTAGFAFYPLGKAPSQLFFAARAGGTFGLLYTITAQASLGWQFIFDDDFALSLGADFAYYISGTNGNFYIPSASIAFGWGF